MQYFGTNFCLTLGAMRFRFAFMLEDAPDDAPFAHTVHHVVHGPQSPAQDRVHSN